MFSLVAVVLAAVPVVADEPPDISCNAYNTFATNIERGMRLKISGPKEKTWEVLFESGYKEESRLMAEGTYELTDGLAVFTGKKANQETRFALNYGFFGGKVYFNVFIPGSDDKLHYRRQWYQKVQGQWKLSEELVLALPGAVPDKERWEVRLTGERRRWDEVGKMTVTKIEKTLTYQQDSQNARFFDYQQARPAEDPVAAPQRLKVVGKRLEDDPTWVDTTTAIIPRGFVLPEKPCVPK